MFKVPTSLIRPSMPRTFLFLLGIWSVIVGCILGLVLYFSTREEREIALNRAMDSYHKDLTYRRWASERGGVYVPLNGKTPPNPHLSHRPDRDITTSQGKALTLVNPAYMTRMVHELGADAYGLQGHITSLHPIRPENAPDAWERRALESFERGARNYSEVLRENGRPVLRYMGAFLVDSSCLACHAQQGYKVGDVRGGISVTVPVGSGPAALGLSHKAISLLAVASFWLMGAGAIFGWVRRLVRSAQVQQRMVEELKERSQRFEAIRATTPDSLWFLDREGHLQWANETYCRLSGYGREELLGQPISRVEILETPEDTARRVAAIQQGLDAEHRFRTQHRAKDGRILDLEVTTSLMSSKGEIVAFLRDITQEVQASRQIRESEARFRQLFESSPAPMFIHREGRILHANLALARLLEAEDPGGILNREVMPFIHPDFQVVVRERARALHESNLPAQPMAMTLLTLKGHEVWVEVQSVSLDLPGGLATLVFAQDLTERRRAEDERLKLETEIQHAQKLDSLGSLAGGIAHDMNNVLAAILGMSSLLQAKAQGDDALGRSLQTIEKAAGRGRDLVKGLTDFARKGLQEARIMDLNAMVREELDLLVRTSRQRFIFEVQLEDGLPPIMGEPSTLGSAFMNLCVNAFDAMPRGGTLQVSTRRQGAQVILVVADTGQGIPAEVLPRVTEPFFTTKPTGRGTGLGLAMVYGTMKAHGGTLDIQSEVGKGTCISLSFPAAEKGAVAAGAKPAASAPQAASLRILVVDDDALIRSILPAMLEQLGHQVETASSGLEALRRLDAGLPADLVILDHNMPGLSGAETLPRILQLRPGLRVLVTTGFLDNELKLLLAGFPAVLALQKPFTLAELRQLLEGLAGQDETEG